MIEIIYYSFLGLSMIAYGGYTTIKEIIKEKRRKIKLKKSLLNNQI